MAMQQIKGILYTYPGNIQGFKAQIAAKYSGAALTIADENRFIMNKTNRSEEYVTKFPTGKVPAFQDDTGVCLFEPNAIAHYLSNEQLCGRSLVEQAEVLQWIEYSGREIYPVSVTLVYPCMGILQFNKNSNEHAKSELKTILRLLNEHLLTRTYFVGERITLADITIACDLLLLYQWIIDLEARETSPNLTRWFLTLIHQDEFQAVIGSDIQLCEKTAQFDPKRYAEMLQKNHIPQVHPRPKSLSQHAEDHEEEIKSKRGKKSTKQEEKSAKKPKENNKKEEEHADDDDETDDVLTNEPKHKDPFADMPKPTFNMDEFKRVYSNEDTATVAIPYFWANFDKEHCSIWFCEYKYPEDLTQIFMTCNLISGFFQRLDKLRKHAFASMCVFGENNNNTITGIWIWRGHELAFELSPDWQVDYESYRWKRLSVDDEDTKKLVNQYLLWEGEYDGKKFNQGKIFK